MRSLLGLLQTQLQRPLRRLLPPKSLQSEYTPLLVSSSQRSDPKTFRNVRSYAAFRSTLPTPPEQAAR